MPTTSTALRCASSRHNFLQSTGPRTPEGKARSSMHVFSESSEPLAALSQRIAQALQATEAKSKLPRHHPKFPQAKQLNKKHLSRSQLRSAL